MPREASDHPAERYVADVLAGRVVVGRLVRLACERHVRDLADGATRGLRFNLDRATRACWWVENRLRFSKGEWARKAFRLEPWQAFIVWSLFGWEREVDGRWVRRFRTAYMSVARKNGKSEWAAAIGLMMLITGGASAAGPEQGAEVYSAATTRDQATIVWRAAASMVRKSPDLLPEVNVHDSRYNLSHPKTESRFEALAADADTLDGLGPYCAIVDELHAHPDSTVWDVLDSGTGARREPLLLAITTAGSAREGVCWDVESDCVKILEQVYEDDATFSYIARLDDGDDPFLEANWIKSNPNLGVSVIPDGLRVAAKAAAANPARRNEYLRKRMNLWTAGDTAWIPLSRWDASAGAVDLEALRGRPCYVGVDLSSTRDTTAVVAVFPMDDGSYQVAPWVFVPADTLSDSDVRGPRERQLLTEWSKSGLVTATSGDMVDYDAIWDRLLNLAERCSVQEVVFDRWQSASLIAKCEGVGLTPVGFGQGYKDMNPAMQLVDTLVSKQRLVHGGHPVLRWMVSNVATRTDPAGNVKPDKSKKSARIDGVVAMLMGLGRASSVQSSVPLILAMEA